MTTQPSDYTALLDVSLMRYPPLVIEQGCALADQLEAKMAERGRERGQRTNFGELSALEAAHKLARFVNALSTHDRALVEKWLRGGA